jgi:ATP-dependent RNA helicase MSS116, mitochondrial
VVDCVGAEVATHATVAQSVVVAPLEDVAAALRCELEELMKEPDYKILVFFGTARQTQLYAELWNMIDPKRPVLEIHSRKTQSNRNRTADIFRKNSGQIMFSSDVTARGLDFPDGLFLYNGSASKEVFLAIPSGRVLTSDPHSFFISVSTSMSLTQ